MELYFYKVVKETLKKPLFHGCLNGVKRDRIYSILKKHRLDHRDRAVRYEPEPCVIYRILKIGYDLRTGSFWILILKILWELWRVGTIFFKQLTNSLYII